ncbi:MAG: hypothetical protein ABI688_10200, partial [Bacteroidota bacterium]
MVLGEWILLEANDQREIDYLPNITCMTGCGNVIPFTRGFEDNIEYKWTVTGGNGKFIGGSSGKYVIYQAPTFLPDKAKQIQLVFKVTANNIGTVQADDGEITSMPVTITVYEPGIQMQYPAPDFLPTDKNSLIMRSELKYLDGNKWQPGFAHMGRIHFFELMDVSNEKGICMNDPLPAKATDCLDLQIIKDDEKKKYECYEADKKKPKCTLTDQWLKARSKTPELISEIEIGSSDFGSYGFIRSSTGTMKHIGKDGLYTCFSIPWTDADVPHYHKVPREKKPKYLDNRVTIPLDIDENHIPDIGYPNRKEEMIPDPLGGKSDLDNIPPGDNFKGDGLTDYEEYRGFMYQQAPKKQEGESVNMVGEDHHVRTSYLMKTIFIHNPAPFKLTLYESVSKLEVFEISSVQYQSSDIRVVNFNSNPLTNIVQQKGLYLYDGKSDPKHLNRMGIAKSKTGSPARPNDEEAIIIYSEAIRRNIHKTDSIADSWNNDPALQLKFKGKKFGHLDPDAKLATVVAHELLHGNGVWHHGEGDDNLDVSHDAMNGLRSGDISCVMRYDNTGTKIKLPEFFPEKPGDNLCTDATGTSYNAPEMVLDGNKNTKVVDRGYGNCRAGRGKCDAQIRISGVDPPPKKR